MPANGRGFVLGNLGFAAVVLLGQVDKVFHLAAGVGFHAGAGGCDRVAAWLGVGAGACRRISARLGLEQRIDAGVAEL